MTIRLRAACGAAAAVLGVACGGVGESDPEFWDQSHDLGGAHYQFPGGPAPTGTGLAPLPTGTGTPGPIPTGTTPTPLPTGTTPTPQPTGTTPVPQPTGTTPVPTATGTTPVPSPTGTTPLPNPGTNSGACTFSFSVNTTTANGRYAPRNVGAIWITTASGQFVKTLRTWGTLRLGNATAWQSSSGGNAVDAVTGATRAGHGPIDATWNCTDTARSPVPDGAYRANVTFAEDNAIPFFSPPPHQAAVDFTKGATPVDTGGDAPNFNQMHVLLQ